MSSYTSEQQTAITQKANELLSFIESSDNYDTSFNKIQEFETFIASL